jgi:hypothetical protein
MNPTKTYYLTTIQRDSTGTWFSCYAYESPSARLDPKGKTQPVATAEGATAEKARKCVADKLTEMNYTPKITFDSIEVAVLS